MNNEPKAGFKTSEFWMTAAAVIVGLITASGAFAEDGSVAKVVGVIASALAAMGYSFSRSMVKKTPSSN